MPAALARLERLMDEYSTADGLDPARRDRLISAIREEARAANVEQDLDIPESASPAEAIPRIDRFLCDLKESQFGQGLQHLALPRIPGQGGHHAPAARRPRRRHSHSAGPDSAYTPSTASSVFGGSTHSAISTPTAIGSTTNGTRSDFGPIPPLKLL